MTDYKGSNQLCVTKEDGQKYDIVAHRIDREQTWP